MTNNNITPPCPDCRHPSACHLHGCYTAASQPPVTMDGLVERLRPALKLVEGLETGQDCEEYAFANGSTFQAMTMAPEAFEALRALPDLLAGIPTLLAMIAAKDEALRQVRDTFGPPCEQCAQNSSIANEALGHSHE